MGLGFTPQATGNVPYRVGYTGPAPTPRPVGPVTKGGNNRMPNPVNAPLQSPASPVRDPAAVLQQNYTPSNNQVWTNGYMNTTAEMGQNMPGYYPRPIGSPSPRPAGGAGTGSGSTGGGSAGGGSGGQTAGGLGTYQTGIDAGRLPQASIDQALGALNTRPQGFGTPYRSQSGQNMLSDFLRAGTARAKGQLGRDAAYQQGIMDLNFQKERSDAMLGGFSNLYNIQAEESNARQQRQSILLDTLMNVLNGTMGGGGLGGLLGGLV